MSVRAPWVVGAALGLCLSAVAPTSAQTLPDLRGQLVYGTQVVGTTVNLVSFDETAPTTIRSTVAITGLPASQVLVGMDVRPITGQLYGLTYDASLTADNARLYIINPTTGVATQVGSTAMTLALGTTTDRVGFDFNPVVDLLRVVSTNKANYRLNPVTATVVDSDPAMAGIQRDADLNTAQAGVTNPTIGAVAYGSNFFGTGASTLYAYDTALNQLFIQSPPNAGVLSAVGEVSGVTLTNPTGISMDINSTRTGEDYALLAVSTGTTTQLFQFNLGSGRATTKGTVALPLTNITFATFSVDPVSPPAPLTGQLLYALTGGNLISFDSNTPRVIRTSTPISGLTAGQTLVGLDSRPANGDIYALGYNAAVAAPATNSQLYRLNPSTGALTAVGTAQRLELGAATDRVGFDFNPVADLIRVVATNNVNLRLSPVTGALTNTDTPLNPTTAAVSAAAYTNSSPGPAPASTVLYHYDATNNQLVQQTPVNSGTLAAVGSASGITVNAAGGVDFDIFFDATAAAGAQNKAFLVASTGTGTFVNSDRLFTVNLTTGAATEVEVIGAGMPITGVTAQIAATVLSADKASAKLSAQVDVFPNPATSEVSISMPAKIRKQSVEVTLVNSLGQQVVSRTIPARDGSTQRLSLNGVAKGVYTLQLTTSEGIITKRLLVH